MPCPPQQGLADRLAWGWSRGCLSVPCGCAAGGRLRACSIAVGVLRGAWAPWPSSGTLGWVGGHSICKSHDAEDGDSGRGPGILPAWPWRGRGQWEVVVGGPQAPRNPGQLQRVRVWGSFHHWPRTPAAALSYLLRQPSPARCGSPWNWLPGAPLSGVPRVPAPGGPAGARPLPVRSSSWSSLTALPWAWVPPACGETGAGSLLLDGEAQAGEGGVSESPKQPLPAFEESHVEDGRVGVDELEQESLEDQPLLEALLRLWNL